MNGSISKCHHKESQPVAPALKGQCRSAMEIACQTDMEYDTVIFNWRINNFKRMRNMAKNHGIPPEGDVITSPIYVDVQGGQWWLRLYPYEDREDFKGKVSLFLHTDRPSKSDIFFSFHFTALDANAQPIEETAGGIEMHKFERSDKIRNFGFFDLIENQNVIDRCLIDGHAVWLFCEVHIFSCLITSLDDVQDIKSTTTVPNDRRQRAGTTTRCSSSANRRSMIPPALTSANLQSGVYDHQARQGSGSSDLETNGRVVTRTKNGPLHVTESRSGKPTMIEAISTVADLRAGSTVSDGSSSNAQSIDRQRRRCKHHHHHQRRTDGGCSSSSVSSLASHSTVNNTTIRTSVMNPQIVSHVNSIPIGLETTSMGHSQYPQTYYDQQSTFDPSQHLARLRQVPGDVISVGRVSDITNLSRMASIMNTDWSKSESNLAQLQSQQEYLRSQKMNHSTSSIIVPGFVHPSFHTITPTGSLFQSHPLAG